MSKPAWRLCLGTVALLAGCASLPTEPRNPCVLETEWGVATGKTTEQVRTLAEVVGNARGELARLPGFVDRPLRIHITSEALPKNFAGMTVSPEFGHAWVTVEWNVRLFAFHVVHELGHFYFDELFGHLPVVLEEGYCEWLANRLYPDARSKSWSMVVVAIAYLDQLVIHVNGKAAKAALAELTREVPPPAQALRTQDGELRLMPEHQSDAYYALGWILAECLGREGLLRLESRRRAEGLERVPPEWILEATGLEPFTPEALRAALAKAMGDEPPPAGEPLTIRLQDG